jgi:Flp pilus assembly pilin Flp
LIVDTAMDAVGDNLSGALNAVGENVGGSLGSAWGAIGKAGDQIRQIAESLPSAIRVSQGERKEAHKAEP